MTSQQGTLAKIALPDAISDLVYDDGNRLTSRNGQALTYDNDGNLTSDGITTYTWDARGQLAKLERPDLTATFGYNPAGDRSQRTINGNQRTFLSDGPNPIAETDGTTTSNLLSASTDEWISRTTAAGTGTYLTDIQGSVLALGDSSGALKATYAYDPYGNAATTGDAEGNSYGYTGREDDGTGLMYYRARYYSPTLQRFISEDPIGIAGGANLYAYTNNSPTNYTDPSGNNPLIVGCVIGGLTDGAINYLTQRLSGRKVDWGWNGVGGAALQGCALGTLFGVLGKAAGLGRCLTNSFSEETLVLMADGSRKPIKDIKPGERVWTTDPETGRSSGESVTASIESQGPKTLVGITISRDSDRSAETLIATEGHPFWVSNLRQWRRAADLSPGMWLRTSAGTYVQVGAIEKWTEARRVRNLSVGGAHTYYVVAGETSALVHNCDSARLGRNLIRAGERRPAGVDAQAHHIVPCGCKRVAPAWSILNKHGIDIDGILNGVWMSQKGHTATFKHSYYDYINSEMRAADALGGKQGVLDFLAQLKRELAAVDQYARLEMY